MSPGRPRADRALLTVRVSNSVRRISAEIDSPSIVMRAHDALGAPSKM